MAESTENAETIRQNALAPRRVSGDQGSAEQHSIPDQIAADEYARNSGATKRGRGLGIKHVRLIPPSPTGE